MSLPRASSAAAALFTCLAFLASVAETAAPEKTATEEMNRKSEWVRTHLVKAPVREGGFFSIRYGGRPSAELLPSWQGQSRETKIDDQRVEHLLSWTDPRTGLAVRCREIEYLDFPSVEWTLFFKNTGRQPTPVLEQIQALDLERFSGRSLTVGSAVRTDGQSNWSAQRTLRYSMSAQADCKPL
ncbi:MAG: hypothetical protein ACP5XB_01665 [Isosphaeraceae bacterium]